MSTSIGCAISSGSSIGLATWSSRLRARPSQNTCALQANQSPALRGRVPLGFIVRAHNLVPSPVLSVLLLQQFCDRLSANPATAPRFVGEQMLLSADLTPAQLAMALQEQLDSYQDGRWG